MDKEIGSNGQEEDGKKKKSVLARVLTIIIIILLLLALIVCLIIIFTHRHTMTYYPATAATCTADGNEEFWYCAGCERYFADEEGNTEIEYTDAVIPAAGHTWVGASCDSPRHCSVCGFSDGVALGHDFGEYVSDNNATCTADGTQTATCSRCGETDTKILAGSALGHSYGANLVVSADCIHSGSITRTCTVCGDINTVSVPATGVHDWNFSRAVLTPATGTSEGTLTYTCRNCDETLDISVPATGEHSWQFDRGQVTAVPTCTEAGKIEYACNDCSQKLTITIPANAGAHSWDEGEVTEPTCTEAGSVVFTCTLCGQTLSATIDNPGHEWQEATCTAPKTCAVCGATEGEALGHDWQEATCTAPQICQTCGITQGEALGHDWKDATCTSPQICKTCGITRGDALGHDYEEEVSAATCTKDGSVTLTCSLCGDIQSVPIPATGVHNWDIANITAPTCNAAGSIEYTCSICNATKTESIPIDSDAHDWGNGVITAPTCMAAGSIEYTCTICNATKTEIIPIDSNAHNWDWTSGTVTTPATATTAGKITYSCSNEGCNQTLTLDIPATGVHNWDLANGNVTAVPTCTAEGKIEYACKDCAETLEVIIPVNAAAHSWDSGVLNEPTCTTAGSVVFTCKNCSETLEVTVPANVGAHSWDEGEVTPPTCEEAGSVVFSCTNANCEETLKVTIPATGVHDWDIANGNVTAHTCTTDGKVVFSCKNCAETLEVTIPAHGHVWVDATCTASEKCAVCGIKGDNPALGHTWGSYVSDGNATCTSNGTETATCSVCGATNTRIDDNSALGHTWGNWNKYSDNVHMRECEICHVSEVEEHDFTAGDTCSVCNAAKPAASAGTEITLTCDNITQVFDGSMDMDYEISDVTFSPGGVLHSTFGINFTAETDMTVSIAMPENFSDAYVSIFNDSEVTLEYHPIRFTLYIENEAGNFEAVPELSGLSMEEFIEAFNENKFFNYNVSAGETVDFAFIVEAAWAEYIELPGYFEITGSDGNVYKFADSATNSSEWYLSRLDTALGRMAAGKKGDEFTYDFIQDSSGQWVENQKWTINYDDSYSLDIYYAFDINITQG